MYHHVLIYLPAVELIPYTIAGYPQYTRSPKTSLSIDCKTNPVDGVAQQQPSMTRK